MGNVVVLVISPLVRLLLSCSSSSSSSLLMTMTCLPEMAGEGAPELAALVLSTTRTEVPGEEVARSIEFRELALLSSSSWIWKTK